jgi:hypothetical protein
VELGGLSWALSFAPLLLLLELLLLELLLLAVDTEHVSSRSGSIIRRGSSPGRPCGTASPRTPCVCTRMYSTT